MRSFIVIGAILLILGITLLFVPIRHTVRHGFSAGSVSVHVDTVQRNRIHPAVGGVLVACGVAMMIAGSRKRP